MERKTEYMEKGHCKAHGGSGTNLNYAHSTGLVAQHFKLVNGGYVCDDCWKAACVRPRSI